MINIFFIHRFPFNKEAYIRDEFEFLEKQGYNVKYLDIANLLKKKKFEQTCPGYLLKYVIALNAKKEYTEFLKKNSKNTLIVTDVGLLSNSAWMYIPIFKLKIPFVLFENTSLPSIPTKKSLEDRKRGIIKFFKSINLKKISQKPGDFVKYYSSLPIISHAEMIITSKSKLRAEKKILKGDNTEMKYSMSLDYKMAMDIGTKATVKEDYAVFIDQYFVHHPDFKTNHIVHSFTADQYYGELNEYLKHVRKVTGLKIVIASHPRRKHELTKDFNEEFQLFYNKTGELIKNSKLVLVHFSTSINFAVIFNKPFILLTSKLFSDSNVLSGILMFSKFFNKPMVDMKDRSVIDISKEEKKIDKNKYNDFLEKYIKHPDATDESFRENIMQIMDRLKLN